MERRTGDYRRETVATFSPSGKVFAATGANAGIGSGPVASLWTYPDLAPFAVLEGHKLPVVRVVWSPDEARLLTIGKDDRVLLWDADTGALLADFKVTQRRFHIEFSASGALLLYQEDDERMFVVDAKTGKRLFAFSVHALDRATFDSSEKRIIIVEGKPGHEMSLRVLDIREETRSLAELASVGQEWGEH